MADTPSVMECARLFLSPPLGAFWRWSEDLSAIEWIGGGTILLREELQQLARRRVDTGCGLPPLQAIVFLMALLRSRSRATEMVPDVDLPPTDHLWPLVRTKPAARAELVSCALHSAPTNSREFAERVATALVSELPRETLAERDFQAFAPSQVAKWLLFGLRSLTAERVDLLVRAGVEEVPEPADLTLAVREPPEALMRSLEGDRELSGIVGVVRQVMAALRLRHLALHRDEQPAGGFAGIGNRGSLDRLLPSELANDEDLLAVRIATNEALYVRREVPPYEPRTRRRVLLDAGVRMWGTPRILGVAVALALRLTAPRGGDFDASVADGARVVPVDLGARIGIVRQLEYLAATLDARDALPAFLGQDTVYEERHSMEGVDELIVIAHRDSVADPAFVAACRAGASGSLYLAAVSETGTFRLVAVTARGLEVCSEAQLDVPQRPRRMLTDAPRFYCVPKEPLEPVPLRKGRPDDVTGVGSQGSEIVLQVRRGRSYALRLERKGRRVVLVVCDVAAAMVPFAPCPWNSGEQSLSLAELGDEWLVFHDRRGFVHFVPRDGDAAELSIAPAFASRVVGWCSQTGHLEGAPLAARLRQIAEAVR